MRIITTDQRATISINDLDLDRHVVVCLTRCDSRQHPGNGLRLLMHHPHHQFGGIGADSYGFVFWIGNENAKPNPGRGTPAYVAQSPHECIRKAEARGRECHAFTTHEAAVRWWLEAKELPR